ncbi:hypothetical protein ACJJTC_004107 [Scirpophaga incertulas]
MNTNATEDDIETQENTLPAESPRKRPRLENTVRKSWSLMDRRTDDEVLHEMGVGLLEPDDQEPPNEIAHQSGLQRCLKRKRDIENVNPNANCATSSHSPRGKGSPSAGPSRVRSPKSLEKTKPLQPSENILETSLTDEYLIDEETPLAQVSAAPLAQITEGRRRCVTPLGLQDEIIIYKLHKSEPEGVDSFNILSDEMILSVFRWLPKRTLTNCMLVCKRWHRVAYDETLWQRLDLGNKSLSKDALGKILARKPMIVRLASSEIAEWHPTTPAYQSRIQYLDLSISTIDTITLNCLLERCSALKKLSLESVKVVDRTCEFIGRCNNLETLNLTMAQGVTADGVSFIVTGCTNLQSLNISWCNLSEDALTVLVTGLPQNLQRLNLAGARSLTNEMVEQLCEQCPRLAELDASDCCKLTAPSISVLRNARRLRHLALSRCYLLPPATLTKLSSMVSLQYLEVWGMLQSTSLNALRAALPAIQINQFMFSAIARPTVGTRRTSLWGLRTRD